MSKDDLTEASESTFFPHSLWSFPVRFVHLQGGGIYDTIIFAEHSA